MGSSEEKFRSIFHAGCYSDLLQLSDGKLQTEDGCTFEINRIILAKSSDYFRAMFCGIDKHRREFTIPGISGWCLCEILSYIYTSDISVTEHNIIDLLIAADYLSLPDLCQVIRERVKDILTTANCLRLYQATYGMNDENISSQCFRRIQTRFETIARNQKYELDGLPLVILEKILSDRSLCVVDESTIWQIIIEWTKEDLNKRLKHFPKLFTLLATKELDEKLASEILNHEIVTENAILKDFFQTEHGKQFSTHLEVILSFVEREVVEGMDYRMPACLYVIAAQTTNIERNVLYVTYDEKLDLWRKIGEMHFQPDYTIPVGNSIIFFSVIEGDCLKFDLINELWTPMRRFRSNISSVVEINGQIFVFGTIYFSDDQWTFGFEVYDAERDFWHYPVPLENVRNAVAVAVSRNIYVIGNARDSDRMVAFAFDIDKWEWYHLPQPNFFRTTFSLLAFHDNLYLIGGSNNTEDISKAEVFVTATATWQELPELPHTYSWVHAMVWEDQIVVFDEDEEGWNMSRKDVRWNEEKYCWENKHCWESPLVDFHDHRFCELRDVNAVRSITRKNRNPHTELERSYFSL